MIITTTFSSVFFTSVLPLLMSLCTTILAQHPEPSLDDIFSLLTSSADANIKIEEEQVLYYTHSQPCGHRPSQTASTNPIDDKGFTWCDTARNNCHWCSCPGHVAAKCIIAMPTHVKDWVLTSTMAACSHMATKQVLLDHTQGYANFTQIPHISIYGKSLHFSVTDSSSFVHTPSNNSPMLL